MCVVVSSRKVFGCTAARKRLARAVNISDLMFLFSHKLEPSSVLNWYLCSPLNIVDVIKEVKPSVGLKQVAECENVCSISLPLCEALCVFTKTGFI